MTEAERARLRKLADDAMALPVPGEPVADGADHPSVFVDRVVIGALVDGLRLALLHIEAMDRAATREIRRLTDRAEQAENAARGEARRAVEAEEARDTAVKAHADLVETNRMEREKRLDDMARALGVGANERAVEQLKGVLGVKRRR